MAESQSWQTVKGGKAVKKEPAKKKKKKEQSFTPLLLQDARELKSHSNKCGTAVLAASILVASNYNLTKSTPMDKVG